MITAIDIFDEVEADVAALNGEIVRRAFHGRCCDFVDNQEHFESSLNYYIALRLKIHRMKRRLEDNSWRWDLTSWGSRYSWTELKTYQVLAADAGRRIHNVWPCAACICLYNPTHRLRRFPQLA